MEGGGDRAGLDQLRSGKRWIGLGNAHHHINMRMVSLVYPKSIKFWSVTLFLGVPCYGGESGDSDLSDLLWNPTQEMKTLIWYESILWRVNVCSVYSASQS